MACEFSGNKFRGVRIVRQHLERLFAIFFSARVKSVAHNNYFPFGVKFGLEDKFRITAGLADSPATKTAGHLNHVLLRIAGIHADGVKFHHLAAVVFVEATVLIVLLSVGPSGLRKREINSEATLKASAAHGHFLLMTPKCSGVDA